MQLRCSHSLIYRAVSTAKQQKRQIQEQKKLQFINYSWPFWFFNGYLYHTKHANMERKPIKTCYWIVKSIKSSLQLEKIDDIQTGSPNYGWHTKWLTGATLPYHTFFTWWAFSTSPIRRIFFVFLFFALRALRSGRARGAYKTQLFDKNRFKPTTMAAIETMTKMTKMPFHNLNTNQ